MIIGGIVQMNVFLEDEGKKYRGTFFRETKQMKEGSFWNYEFFEDESSSYVFDNVQSLLILHILTNPSVCYDIIITPCITESFSFV